MVFTAAVISVVTAVCLSADWAGSEYAALIAGAVGAVVSVVQRINAGQFDLEYDVGRPYAFFLGGLRPLIGGAFALVIAFAFKSGVLHLPLSKDRTTSEEQFALIVLGFISGFSERFAKDTLAAAAATAVPSFDKPETTETTIRRNAGQAESSARIARTRSGTCGSAALVLVEDRGERAQARRAIVRVVLAEQDPDQVRGPVQPSPEVVVLARVAVEERPEVHELLALDLVLRVAWTARVASYGLIRCTRTPSFSPASASAWIGKSRTSQSGKPR